MDAAGGASEAQALSPRDWLRRWWSLVIRQFEAATCDQPGKAAESVEDALQRMAIEELSSNR